jgi:hypothetical protein
MRAWQLPTALVLVLSGCADVNTSSGQAAPGGGSSPSTSSCVVPSDALPAAVTLKLKPPAAHLQRPLAAKGPEGLLFLAANVLTADGTVRSKGAVWVAKDDQGNGLAALTDEAKRDSSLPDAATQ